MGPTNRSQGDKYPELGGIGGSDGEVGQSSGGGRIDPVEVGLDDGIAVEDWREDADHHLDTIASKDGTSLQDIQGPRRVRGPQGIGADLDGVDDLEDAERGCQASRFVQLVRECNSH